MVSFPLCKINLGLTILSKRSDGYHDIETIFFPVPWTDILEIIPSTTVLFESSGNPIPGKQEDNLCLKAYHLLKKDFNLPAVKIHLHKIIPTGAGLGGGSSDAAYTLRTLNELFDLKLTPNQLSQYAAQLGSDCSFFCYDGPMLGTGRGELLEAIEINLKGKFLVLVNPDIHVSTAAAYAGVVPHQPDYSLREIVQRPLVEWKNSMKNDFEESIFKIQPAIKKLKDEMYDAGATYASMSGSGSSVFGIFENKIQLPESFSPMTHWSGFL